MNKWEMYLEIPQLLKQGFSKVKVAKNSVFKELQFIVILSETQGACVSGLKKQALEKAFINIVELHRFRWLT